MINATKIYKMRSFVVVNLFEKLVVQKLFLTCSHLRLSTSHLHLDNRLDILIQLNFQGLSLRCSARLQGFQLFSQVGYSSLKDVNFSFLLSHCKVNILKMLLLVCIFFSPKGLQRRYSSHGPFSALSIQR